MESSIDITLVPTQTGEREDFLLRYSAQCSLVIVPYMGCSEPRVLCYKQSYFSQCLNIWDENMIKKITLMLLAVLLTGCGGSIQYVVSRDVPPKPSITVMPTYVSAVDNKYITEMEGVLINLGISVIAPPGHKIVTKTTGEGTKNEKQAESSNSEKSKSLTAAEARGESVTEEFRMYDETTATHIVIVDSINRTFRVIKKDTKEVLGAFDRISSPSMSKRYIASAFKTMGFVVRER